MLSHPNHPNYSHLGFRVHPPKQGGASRALWGLSVARRLLGFHGVKWRGAQNRRLQYKSWIAGSKMVGGSRGLGQPLLPTERGSEVLKGARRQGLQWGSGSRVQTSGHHKGRERGPRQVPKRVLFWTGPEGGALESASPGTPARTP